MKEEREDERDLETATDDFAVTRTNEIEDNPQVAAALRDLVLDPAARARLAEGSRRLQASLLSWQDFAASCLALYRTISRQI